MNKKVEKLITVCSNERFKNVCFELMTKALDEEDLCVGNKKYKTMITPTSDTTAQIFLIATNNEWKAEFNFNTMTGLVELIAIGC